MDAQNFSSSALVIHLALSLAVLPMLAGCSPRTVGLELHAPSGTTHAGPAKSADEVEVWLDEAPKGDFVVVAELEARSLDSTVSIARMQERAAQLGFDGIYWIACTSACSGDCTAKAFKYSDAAKLGDRQIASR